MSKRSRVPCKSVLITFHGDTTHATQLTGYDHDTRTKSACAKRNPTDEYSAYEGARIALARLFGVDPFPEQESVAAPEKPATPEKKPLEYKVGARVRIVTPVANFGYTEGDVGTVVRMSDPDDLSKGCDVQFDHLNKVCYCYRSEFELIDADTEKSLPEYKTGARVRVIEPRGAADYHKGDVGTVVRIPYGPESGAYIQFDHLRGPEKYRAGIRYCYRSEFELTGETVEKRKKPETPKVIKDFKVEVTVTPVYEEDA